MKLAVPKERRSDEARVAISPEVAKKLVGLGVEVVVETGAGLGADVTDDMLKDVGVTIAPDAKTALGDADLVWKIQRPMTADEGTDEIALMKRGATLMCHLNALTQKSMVDALTSAGVSAFAMELMPRISRAQSMDILSSQANLGGYKAVIEAANAFSRAFPMMMTAAGTVPPARVLVFGAGVAGLQAVATAKRMGAAVQATDVRPATREQVESLGGKFVTVDAEMEKQAETSGGYAKEMPPEYFEKQKQVISEVLKKTDIVITTALIPGRPAPKLVTAEQVRSMKKGSVIVDMAVEAGGNCELSEAGKMVEVDGVKIIGYPNLPTRVAADASPLFAKNLLNFFTPMFDKEAKALKLNWEDETIKGTCVCHDGKVVHPALVGGSN
ncbi:Re/Si-specific NAD(P)(+) transhydrogenase subunit alpha [Roseospira marina]|uniref:NAD(P) transhydrogenase subunit alpha part 1 n=1 Tax=Roseospira marina TaxID=140057 RepID=A0A5M6IIQ4_9PROT|nr:Re/Si-specific NAD(P)(+) transhydrogenase subunit alpha [Roseospira marina]KAA5607468.1 Re/Si-specific NAD(P)(+) transhydrogenase subunit alpha [Roseospira marina]MBB4312352.1 NAD(P) transhydrogenase subunit alpha [Roseospira marina]MBB5085632.1 NAD(P) transhydrogenase subunit alpha [Roseospira marina]